ncbi:MAG: hypothetical protein ACF788_00035, partial [Novipirellula sp. JB048]
MTSESLQPEPPRRSEPPASAAPRSHTHPSALSSVHASGAFGTSDHRRRRPASAAFLFAALVAGSVGIATYHTIPLPNPEPRVEREFEAIVPQAVEPSREVLRAAFFDREVAPQIESTDRLNREAADRCVERIERLIRRYHRG